MMNPTRSYLRNRERAGVKLYNSWAVSTRVAPIVAIVGRANVGKSSLFNALIDRREAIVARETGTTRDRVTAKASYQGKDFWLVDTAGLKQASDEFELTIQQQIADAAAQADLTLVVVEADVPATDEDRQVAKMALKSRKPVILVVNKIDKHKDNLAEWQRLGIKQMVATSTTQKIGLEELLDSLVAILPAARIRDAPGRLWLAILGRPNVGKSSLFNTLAKKQQALVHAQAGTTRDVNRALVKYHERPIEILDTAGIRRSGKIETGVEKFSVLRALSAIEEADICAVLMDAAELNTQLDQKIAGLVKEAGKGLVLVVNKWDIIDKQAVDRQDVAAQVADEFAFVPWAPLVFASALTGENVAKLFDLAIEIDQARQQKFATNELNSWLKEAVNNHSPAGLPGSQPNLSYIVQEEDQPLPSFKILGSHIKFLHWSYKRYLEHSFREKWPLVGTPLKFWFIEKK